MVLKRIICTLAIAFMSLWGVSAQSYSRAESFLFSFKEENDLFLADYGENASELEAMGQLLTASRSRLRNNEYHLLIIAHTGASHLKTDAVINEASLRANRLRAYIISKLNIPSECIAFYIDRSGGFDDQVHVYQVHRPLPWFANQEISYSESRYTNAVRSAVKRYGAVPYADLYPRGNSENYERHIYVIDDQLFDRSEVENYRLAVYESTVADTFKPATAGSSGKAVAEVAGKSETPAPRVPAVAKTTKQPLPEKPEASLISLAVKTNLLPWCGIAPSVLFTSDGGNVQKGAFMPNLEVECYFGNRWSVSLAGMYANFTYKNWEDNKWAVSALTLTPRFWPLGKGHRWLSVGVFGQYGDFDVRGEEISNDRLFGKTGRFCSGGAAIGCQAPLGAGFAVEAEVQAGYRSVFDGEKYRYDEIDAKNYLESRFSSSGFLMGFRLNLVYRFAVK